MRIVGKISMKKKRKVEKTCSVEGKCFNFLIEKPVTANEISIHSSLHSVERHKENVFFVNLE